MPRFSEHIAHVDMDAFFVEVERLRDPTLVGRPVIVGGLGRRGVVAAASYEARRSGVHSAMPMVEARRRCPGAVYLPPDHDRYGSVSAQVFEVVASITPLVEALSVDEAFLEIGGLHLHHPSPDRVGETIRSRIRASVGIPASVGIAASKFVAKLASEAAKPDGLVVVRAGEESGFLDPLPVSSMWGVGAATLALLQGLGIHTVGELAATPQDVLERRVGRSLGAHLSALANARDDRSVEPNGEMKSISVEETFSEDLTTADQLERHLLRLCTRLGGRTRRAGVGGRTVSLKVRFADFTTLTRSETVPAPLHHSADIWDVARVLMARIETRGRRIRLLGVGVSGLSDWTGPRQLSLAHPQRDAVAEAADKVRDRFGDDAVLPARLLESPSADGFDRTKHP